MLILDVEEVLKQRNRMQRGVLPMGDVERISGEQAKTEYIYINKKLRREILGNNRGTCTIGSSDLNLNLIAVQTPNTCSDCA